MDQKDPIHTLLNIVANVRLARALYEGEAELGDNNIKISEFLEAVEKDALRELERWR